MVHLAKSLIAKLWLLLILLLVVAALVSGLGRILTSVVSSYRVEVEQWATEGLGQPVSIGQLEASWSGLRPELILKDFTLLAPGSDDPVLQLAEARVTLAPIDSLLSRAVQSHDLTLVGVQLLIKRRSDGSVVAAGLEEVGSAQGNATALFLVPSRINVERSEIHWQNLAIGGAPVQLSNVNASLRNAGRSHQLDFSFDPPGGQGSRVRLIADIQGELDKPQGWAGEVYLMGQSLALAELLQHRIPEGYQLRNGRARMELWSGWENGKIRWLEGNSLWSDLHLVQLTAAADSPNRRLEIDRLGGYFRWDDQEDGWELKIEDIAFERLGLNWPNASFSLTSRFDPEGRLHLISGANFLRVEDVSAIVRMFPLPNPEFEQALGSIRPHSDLHDLRFRYDDESEGISWSAQGEVHGLFSKPWKKIPGVENLSARFWVDQERGTLHLNSRDTTLWFPRLFRDPLSLQRVLGHLTWHKQPAGGWHIDAPDLQAGNSDIQTRTRLHMAFPQTAEETVFMDLQTDFKDGNASTTARYLPVGIMRPAVIKWLDQSIVSGQVLAGSCVVRGPLRDFPFHKTHSGRFEVFFETEDLLLDYWPGWPPLEKATADIRFLGNSFDTWIKSARLAGNQITGAHGQIRSLTRTSPFELHVETDGAFRNILQLLRNSPLSKDFGPMTGKLEVGGEANLKLNLAIPISDGSPFQLDGKLRFRDSILELAGSPLTISGIRGDLQFDQERVRAEGIEGLIFGNPLRVDVLTPPDNPLISRVTARAAINSARLAELYPDPTWGLFKGTGNWRLQLDIPSLSPSASTPLLARVDSDLTGIAIDLPAPLGKSAREGRDLQISSAWGKQPLRPLHISYGSVLDLALQIDDNQPASTSIERIGVRLGGGKARMPATAGMEIEGSLENLDLSPWLEKMKKEAQGASKLPLRKLQLQIDHLRWQQLELDQFKLDLRHDQNALTGALSSQRFDGTIRIPDDLQQRPIELRLAQLELIYDPQRLSASPQQPDSPQASLDPARLPTLELAADSLRINEREFGKLQLKTSRLATGLELQTLSIVAPNQTQLTATGQWLKQIDDADRSSIEFAIKTEDLGQLLTDLGYTANVKKAATEIKAKLHWEGAPQKFSIAGVKGDLRMKIGKGQLLEVDPGLGGRVFGLLNINALWRRLSLDFSDLFQKGFSFDSIKGDFRLEQGNAYTDNFRIKGPAAGIDLSGRIGLAAEDLDQRVEVTPKVSSALPVAAALLGTPAVGAAVLVAQQLLGSKVDKAGRTEYQVTGPWNDPLITIIKKKDRPSASDSEKKPEGDSDIFSQGN